MEYRKFGPTDITVSAIGFGCWEVSQRLHPGDGRGHLLGVDRGITCFDTAAVYGDGESERMLGKALGSRRKDVVVVTKCGAGYANRPPKGRDGRREAIFSSVEESLQNLQSDYVDVLMPPLAGYRDPVRGDDAGHGRTRATGEGPGRGAFPTSAWSS